MAKDDFFVIAYRIMAYLYACMKAGEAPRTDELSAERLGINERYHADIITSLYQKGYIDGVREIHLPGSIKPVYDISRPRVTMDGIEWLQNNTTMAKAKEALKEIKATVPMI